MNYKDKTAKDIRILLPRAGRGRKGCGNWYDGWACSRPSGHLGPHCAYVCENPYIAWEGFGPVWDREKALPPSDFYQFKAEAGKIDILRVVREAEGKDVILLEGPKNSLLIVRQEWARGMRGNLLAWNLPGPWGRAGVEFGEDGYFRSKNSDELGTLGYGAFTTLATAEKVGGDLERLLPVPPPVPKVLVKVTHFGKGKKRQTMIGKHRVLSGKTESTVPVGTTEGSAVGVGIQRRWKKNHVDPVWG